MPSSPIVKPLELEGCIFQHLAMQGDRIELELRGLTLAPPASPELERIAVVCTHAKVLTSDDQVRTIEALPDWYRQIDSAMLIKEDIVYLAMSGGASILVHCQAHQIDHAPLQYPSLASNQPHQEDRVKGGDDKDL
jgi:hypothetical protein